MEGRAQGHQAQPVGRGLCARPRRGPSQLLRLTAPVPAPILSLGADFFNKRLLVKATRALALSHAHTGQSPLNVRGELPAELWSVLGGWCTHGHPLSCVCLWETEVESCKKRSIEPPEGAVSLVPNGALELGAGAPVSLGV